MAETYAPANFARAPSGANGGRAPGAVSGSGAPGAGASARGGEQSAQAFVEQAIRRLTLAVEEETQALKDKSSTNLKQFHDRKNHGLLELNRAMRFAAGKPMDDTLSGQLADLRAKLETNQLVLKQHLEAVREISTIVSDAIREADSDGTYSVAIRSGGSL